MGDTERVKPSARLPSSSVPAFLASPPGFSSASNSNLKVSSNLPPSYNLNDVGGEATVKVSESVNLTPTVPIDRSSVGDGSSGNQPWYKRMPQSLYQKIVQKDPTKARKINVYKYTDIPDTPETANARGLLFILVPWLIFAVAVVYLWNILKRDTIWGSQQAQRIQYSWLNSGHIVDWIFQVVIALTAKSSRIVFFAALFQLLVWGLDVASVFLMTGFILNNTPTAQDWVNWGFAIALTVLSLIAFIGYIELFTGLRDKVKYFFSSKVADSERFTTAVYLQTISMLMKMGYDMNTAMEMQKEVMKKNFSASSGEASLTYGMAGYFTEDEKENAVDWILSEDRHLENPNAAELVIAAEMRKNDRKVEKNVRGHLAKMFPDKFTYNAVDNDYVAKKDVSTSLVQTDVIPSSSNKGLNSGSRSLKQRKNKTVLNSNGVSEDFQKEVNDLQLEQRDDGVSNGGGGATSTQQKLETYKPYKN